ncbi:uncharacterized protein LOC131947936 isoform X2 [Physella acuta]|nr:uncharacterized protein LOC131947936 isoform X2 [Physella acuta]
MTKAFEITCVLDVTENENLTITSINITRGYDEEIASVSKNSLAKVYNDSNSITATGKIQQNKQAEKSFIKIKWSKPSLIEPGMYICSANFENQSLETTALESSIDIDVRDPNPTEIMSYIVGIEKAIEENKKSIRNLFQVTENARINFGALERNINNKMYAQSELLTPHIEEGIIECNSRMFTRTPDKLKALVVRVYFRKSYMKSPKVFLGITTLDMTRHSNIRYYVAVQQVYTHGFDFVCGSWDDSWVYKMKTSWIAFKS